MRDDGDGDDPWRGVLTFAATSGLIGLSFGVLARTSGLSLAMTLRDVAARLRRRRAVPRRRDDRVRRHAARRGPRRHRAQRPPPPLRPRHRAAPARAAVEARALEPDRARRVDRALARTAHARARAARVLRLRLRALPGWNLGTLVGALAGGAIGDPATLGLDAAFPASMLALLAPLLRRRDVRAAALAGGRDRARRHALHRARRADPAGGGRRARRARSCRGRRHDLVGDPRAGGGHLRLKAAGPVALGRARAAAVCSARSRSSPSRCSRPWSRSARSAMAGRSRSTRVRRASGSHSRRCGCGRRSRSS